MLDPSGNRSIVESCTEAHGTDCPASHDHYAPSFGDRDADDLCAADSTVVSAVYTTPLTGGTVRTDKLASPTALSASPSESAQSTAGGGGWGLKDCMAYWDRDTHMSKSEWRGACQRSAQRLDNLRIDDLTLGLPKKATPKPRKDGRGSGRS